MLTLVQFPGPAGWSLSPYCNKVHLALGFKRLAYRAETHKFARGVSATKRLPVLVDGDVRVHDSSEILRWLDAHHPERPLQRDAQTYVREEWADEALIRICQYARSAAPGFARRYAELALPELPGALAQAATVMNVRKTLKAFAHVGERGHDAFVAERDRAFDALTELLGPQAFMGGETPDASDAAIGPALLCLYLLPNESQDALEKRARLRAYLDRIRKEGNSPI